MRRAVIALVLSTCACTAIDEPAQVASIRQAGGMLPDAGPDWIGVAMFAHLGSVISPCPVSGFIAGAPGDDSVVFISQGLRVSPMRGSIAARYPVLCLGSGTGLGGFVGGATPVKVTAISGTWSSIGNASVESLALSRYPATLGAIAVGRPALGRVDLFAANSTQLDAGIGTFGGVIGIGSALAWHPFGLVVGNAETASVALRPIALLQDGGVSVGGAISFFPPDLAGPDFGAVVAVGDVDPSAGEEIIIAAPDAGHVYIFSSNGFYRRTLTGNTSFGASLWVDPHDAAGGLHALWVGEPQQDLIHYFLGDLDTPFSSPVSAMGGRFGAAIAMDPNGTLAVGAPLYSQVAGYQEGAVYEFTLDAGRLVGVAMPCSNATCMLASCTASTCLGSVFCLAVGDAGSACSLGQTCSTNNQCVSAGSDAGFDGGSASDAGAPDAGLTDAGLTDAGLADAGRSDAGLADAGRSDAGLADAGRSDAGLADAGTQDAGPQDAGEGREDAGTDGGKAEDAGVSSVVFTSSGCSTVGVPMMLLALALGLRRRRP